MEKGPSNAEELETFFEHAGGERSTSR
jgi:hypothetical protein